MAHALPFFILLHSPLHSKIPLPEPENLRPTLVKAFLLQINTFLMQIKGFLLQIKAFLVQIKAFLLQNNLGEALDNVDLQQKTFARLCAESSCCK